MTGKKITGIILLIIGVVILILSLTADFIAIGPLGGSPGIWFSADHWYSNRGDNCCNRLYFDSEKVNTDMTS